MKRLYFKFFILFFFPTFLLAQKIRSPEEFLGYKIGSRFTLNEKAHAYFEYLAQALPAKIKYQTYGTSYEGRTLGTAIISSETNISRLEEIRQSNLKRTGLAQGKVIDNQPAILFLSYNIHGNEAVSTETAMQVLFDLATNKNNEMAGWLNKVVVVIDPCLNPDGHDRYVNFFIQQMGKTPNPSQYAREHYEPWPWGRYNHYIFDLNRDWAWQTQKETRERLENYYKWMPHVHADFHEMGSYVPYYFAPAAKPYHEIISPWQRELQEQISNSNKKYFDEHNWLYFTREKYDLFYPSYGDTYPIFNGAVGLTFEQGGSGFAGLALDRKSLGDTLTLNDRISHHYGASMATLSALANYSESAVKNFEKYFQSASAGGAGEYKSYIFKSKNSSGNIKSLIEFLENKKITYSFAGSDQAAKGYHYNTDKNENFKIENGDLLIDTYQPQAHLIKVLFEPKTVLEDSITYDLTAWSAPHAFGVDAYTIKERLKIGKTTANQQNQEINNARPYSYLVKWNSLQSLQFLTSILNKKIKVRFAEKEFETGGQKYGAGSLIITRADNKNMLDEFDKIVKGAAAKYGLALSYLSSGYIDKGYDIGSANVRPMKIPRVAIVSGAGTLPTGFGDIWHFFEQQIDYPTTVIDGSTIGNTDWKNFDVLILPPGNYNNILNEKTTGHLLNWIESGGKLIAVGKAVAFLSNKEGFSIKRKIEEAAEPSTNSYELLKEYGKREREQQSDEVQGSIYKINLDNTHPLAFGYGKTYMSLKTEANAYQFLKSDWNVGVIKENALVGGFAGSKAKLKLNNSLLFGVQDAGSGSIIYLVDNPLLRGFWHNGKLLFGNAVFMVGNKNESE